MLQTELVACALCEADGTNPDEVVPTGESEVVRLGPDALVERPVMIKAWQRYQDEARKLVIAAQAMEKFSLTLRLFETIGALNREPGHA